MTNIYDGFDINLTTGVDEKEIIEDSYKKGVSHASQVMHDAFEDIKNLSLEDVIKKYELDQNIQAERELITSLKFFEKALKK